jgi:hypothetical protein
LRPANLWPLTYSLNFTLRLGFSVLSEPRKPFLRTPTSSSVSPSTVTVAGK